MLSRFGFLLLLACAACVLLFFAFVERDLWPQAPKANFVQRIFPRPTYRVIDGSSKSRDRVVIEPRCNATYLAWIVTSYAGDPSARSALRRAYTDRELRSLGVRRVFLLGALDGDAERKTRVSRAALFDESRRFDDVLLGDFLDTYRNLTRKHLMGLRWAVRSCERVRYIMKTDDDIVVDVYSVLEKLRSGVADCEDCVVGYLLRNMAPVREPANKWYVSETEYAGNIYPDFVSGWLYVTQPRLASRLLDRVERSHEHFWIDDVFVTGMLRRAANAEIRDIGRYYATDHRYLECCVRGRESLLTCEFLVGPNGGDADLQVRFAEFAEYCRAANCTARTRDNLVGRTCVVAYEEPNPRVGAVQIDAIRIL